MVRERLAVLPTEATEQRTVIAWRDGMRLVEPRLWLLFAIPNDAPGAQRGRAGRMRGLGVLPGVPDLFVAVAARDVHGLFIEMKRREKWRLSDAQIKMHGRLHRAGYQVVTCAGADEAIQAIRYHLDMRIGG